VGESYFTLLEAAPKPDAEYNIRDRIFVGKGERTRVGHILGRIGYDELTSAARLELPQIVEEIVASSEAEFITFFNTSQQVTPRMHSMELIPGIGKRLMRQILDQRERVSFSNFEDLKQRVNLTDPSKLIARRVLKELSEDEKYSLFTRPL
jgi:putative nucleotide binding protein